MANTIRQYDDSYKKLDNSTIDVPYADIQGELKKESTQGAKLLLEVSKLLVKCSLENRQHTTEFHNYVAGNKHKWISLAGAEDDMKNNLEKKYLANIANKEDFFGAFILEEDNQKTIWIISKKYNLKNSKEYIKAAREFKINHDCNFNIVIFDIDEIEEVREQIKYQNKVWSTFDA